MIIGILGFKNSGKNTFGEYLATKYGFKQMSFAAVLKDVISVIFGFDRKMLEGTTCEDRETREIKDEWWSQKLGFDVTPRFLLQHIGTDVIRNHFHDDIWIFALEKQLGNYENVVITDVRFPNEIHFLNRLNAVLVYIEREYPPEWFHDLNKVPKDLHESEWAWVKHRPEICIQNRGSIEDLHREIEVKLGKYLLS